MPEMFNLEHLANSEIETQNITLGKFNDIWKSLPDIIDTFFKLLYFTGHLAKVKTDRGYYQSTCFTHYCQAPFSFWTLKNLTGMGYYLEATIICRHLMEALIQIKYFDKHPEQIEKRLLRKNFKEMFDEFSLGYYTKHFKLLCDAAHGLLFKDLCRFDRKLTPQGQKGQMRMGCEFDFTIANFLVIHIIVLLYGYLNNYALAFPKNILESEPIIYQKLIQEKKFLHDIMEDHKTKFPKSKDWYIHIDKIVN